MCFGTFWLERQLWRKTELLLRLKEKISIAVTLITRLAMSYASYFKSKHIVELAHKQRAKSNQEQ